MAKVIRKKVERIRLTKPTRKVRKNTKKLEKDFGLIHIQAGFHNTIVTITDLRGRVFYWASGGTRRFRGRKKGTSYAGEEAMKEAIKVVKGNGLKQAKVRIKGSGRGRDGALRGILRKGVRLKSLEDATPLPHNGCRPPQKRRV